MCYVHPVDPTDPYLTDWYVEDVNTLVQPSDWSQGKIEEFRDRYGEVRESLLEYMYAKLLENATCDDMHQPDSLESEQIATRFILQENNSKIIDDITSRQNNTN